MRSGTGKLVNLEEMKELLGCSHQTIRTWIGKGMPYEKRPDGSGGRGEDEEWRFDLRKVWDWRVRMEVDRVSSDKPKDRKTVAEAELAELELAKKKGELVQVDVVARTWSEHIMSAKAKLMAIPSKMAPIMAIESTAEDCQEHLDMAIREVLLELSREEVTESEDGADKDVIDLDCIG